uniref:Uncharacterized protein n=1 Tax=Arundo donax TaxID=35708 RepID=A0A0A9CYW3_ARUDO
MKVLQQQNPLALLSRPKKRKGYSKREIESSMLEHQLLLKQIIGSFWGKYLLKMAQRMPIPSLVAELYQMDSVERYMRSMAIKWL